MKKKELKNLAKKIAQCEHIIQTSDDSSLKKKAEEEIMKISSGIHSFEDLDFIDEMVQDLLSKMS